MNEYLVYAHFYFVFYYLHFAVHIHIFHTLFCKFFHVSTYLLIMLSKAIVTETFPPQGSIKDI